MYNIKSFEYAKEKYNLTKDEFENMYNETRRLIFSNCLPEKGKPTAIITGGQPGSGKSGIVVKSRLDFANNNKEVIVLDVDTYRGLYKNADLLAKEFPQYYSEITDPIVGKIMSRLADETLYKGYNFIFEGTMGNTKMIDSVKNSNTDYNIIARILGVSRFESLLSIFERYIEMNKTMGFGRLTTIDAHDIRYENYTNIANTLEEQEIEVEVYKRTVDKKIPIQIYKTSDNNKKYKSVKDALNDARAESYRLCMQNAKQRLDLINKEFKYYCLADNVISELEKLNFIFNREFDRNSEEHEK